MASLFGGLLEALKELFAGILLVLVLMVTGLQNATVYGGYEPPEGSFYIKTSPVSGDAGVTDVIDFELEKDTYSIDEEITARIGFGYLSLSHIDEGNPNDQVVVKVQIYQAQEKDKMLYEKEIRYDGPYSNPRYNTYSEKSFFDFLGKYWYSYYDFYPNFHDDVIIKIPDNLENGIVKISLWVYNSELDKEYCQIYAQCGVESQNGEIFFWHSKWG